MEKLSADILASLRTIENFPIEGISFKDITPLFSKPELVKQAVLKMASISKDYGVTKVVCVESRGFWLGCMLAYELGVPMVPIRKPGKLPFETLKINYQLEYGQGQLEIHSDALTANDVVLIHDDVLATGGTAAASVDLVRNLGADVKLLMFLAELKFLNGREKLSGKNVLIETLIDL